MIAASLLVTAPELAPAPRCRHDGSAIYHVEALRDGITERRRIIFVCGHSFYPEPPAVLVRRVGKPCTHCGGPKTTEEHRKCDRCRTCLRCYLHDHSVAACPRATAGSGTSR